MHLRRWWIWSWAAGVSLAGKWEKYVWKTWDCCFGDAIWIYLIISYIYLVYIICTYLLSINFIYSSTVYSDNVLMFLRKKLCHFRKALSVAQEAKSRSLASRAPKDMDSAEYIRHRPTNMAIRHGWHCDFMAVASVAWNGNLVETIAPQWWNNLKAPCSRGCNLHKFTSKRYILAIILNRISMEWLEWQL